MQARVIQSIAEVEPGTWNGLRGTDNPFVRHEFLHALEESGSVGAASGWQPCHLLQEDDNGDLIAALPLYLKTNSYGEFVFDFAWADAYSRAGLDYYPKLVSAIPFTPATGPRCLVGRSQDYAKHCKFLLAAAVNLADETGASSLHFLFPEANELQHLADAGLLLRKDCQFHWHNRDYESFDAFLGEFTSAKRKKTRRERRRIREAGIRFEVHTGLELDEAKWEQLMPLYTSTFWQRGRHPYINVEFFRTVSQSMPENIVVFVAYKGADAIATAICFQSTTTLYGRYWGSSGFYDSLHFETCYYQGIDYCIRQGLQRFEPGTQGEHKISRGFVPVETWSAHWLSHPQFAAAVDHFLGRERQYVDHYIEAVQDHMPYRKHGQ